MSENVYANRSTQRDVCIIYQMTGCLKDTLDSGVPGVLRTPSAFEPKHAQATKVPRAHGQSLYVTSYLKIYGSAQVQKRTSGSALARET